MPLCCNRCDLLIFSLLGAFVFDIHYIILFILISVIMYVDVCKFFLPTIRLMLGT